MSRNLESNREEMHQFGTGRFAFRRGIVVALLLTVLIVLWPVNGHATISIPVPNINGLSPASVVPGGADFTLTVNGSNFINTVAPSVVFWNSTALVTTYVGRNQLTAVVPAVLLLIPGPGWITVVNVGAPTSNLAFVSVTASTPTVAFVQSDITIGGSVQAVAYGDFNGDGKLDIVTGPTTGTTISVLLGNGDGTFQPAIASVGPGPGGMSVGDFNNDGDLDVAVVTVPGSTFSILLGNGDGTFQAAHTYALPGYAYTVGVADFNSDGKLDAAIPDENGGNNTSISVFLGNGDGTMPTTPTNYASGSSPYGAVVADFNGDGKPDLAISQVGGTVRVFLGDGMGGFVAQTPITVGTDLVGLAVGDFNGDGKADLAVTQETGGAISIFLGNGDGTFQMRTTYPTVADAFGVAVGDLNGDGKLDLAIVGQNAKSVSLLLGNGDGTFQAQQTFGTGTFGWAVAMGDFDGSGRLGLAISDATAGNIHILLQGVVLTPSPVTFATQGVGTTSVAQTVTLTNATGSAVTSTAITFTGTNPADFGETDNCVGIAVPSGGTCAIQVKFTPSIVGAETATISVADNSHGSPQSAILTGTGAVAPVATIAPTGLIFTSQPLAVQSAAQTVTLTNTGTAAMTGVAVSITGTYAADFAQTNTCPATLGINVGCAISVKFTPSLVGSESASLSVADNAAGNPQLVPLSGTGAQITPMIMWATPATITYGTDLSAIQLNATANTAGAFVYTPVLGTVLGAGSQTLSVAFTPTNTATYTSASASVMLTVNKATPVITWAVPAAIPYGTALSGTQLNATASVAGTLVYSPASGTVPAAGNQTLSVTFTPTVTANYAVATGSVTLAVNAAATTNVLSTSASLVSQGASVTFTANLSSSAGVPGGSVLFLDGTTSLGPGTLSGGTATFTTSTLAIGPHTITAAYPATGNFLGSTSSAVTETIGTPTFTVVPVTGSGATPVTVTSGQSAQFQMTLTGVSGFAGQATFTLIGLPSSATGTFSPSTLILSAAPATEVLTVTTTPRVPYVSSLTPTPLTPIHLAPIRPAYFFAATVFSFAGFIFAGFGLPKFKRSSWPLRFAVLGMFAVAAVLGGCGSSGNFQNTGTPAGTYSIVVTVTSGTTQHATTMTLIVQ